MSLTYTYDEVTRDFYEKSSPECISIFQEIVLNTYRYIWRIHFCSSSSTSFYEAVEKKIV